MLQKIFGNLRYWKSLSFKKISYFPIILSSGEKKIALFLLLAAVLSGSILVSRIYLRLTRPVPDTGGTYTEGMLRAPRNINPVFATQDSDRDFSRLMFSGLFTYSGDGALKPDLAERYEISDDGKIYTVFLKKNVLWHDGEKLIADDVTFTIQMAQNPLYRSPLRANWQGVTAEKIDDYTIRLTLRAPYAQFMENLTLGVIPRHLWKDVSPERVPLHELNLKPVGSGPYKFNDISQNKDGAILSIELVRNKRYHLEGPYIKKLKFVFLESADEALTDLRRGLIDGIGPVATTDVSKLNVDVKVYSAVVPRIFGLFFNKNEAPIFEEKAIREAMAYAINRREIASKLGGGVIATESSLPQSNTEESQAVPQYGFDPQKSREILEKAGWKDEDKNGVLEREKTANRKKEKEELRFTLVTSDWPDLIKTAETIKENLSAVGVEISVDIKPLNDLETLIIRPRSFDLLLFGQVYGYETDPFAFWHSTQIKDPGLNVASYSNKDADKLLEEARRAPTKEAREEKYLKLQDQILKDLPAVFLYSQLYLYALPSSIKGVNLQKISLPADRFNEVNLWYKDTKRVLK